MAMGGDSDDDDNERLLCLTCFVGCVHMLGDNHGPVTFVGWVGHMYVWMDG